MERITKEMIVEFISKNEIELASTHTRLSMPIINRIFKKMSANIKIPAIKVEGNFICDGHHRYVASLLAKYPLERISWVITSATSVIDWKTVSFDDGDWDTEEEVNLRNRQDADYNNISIEKIVELLK
ncbi:MAG: hypothetical protein QM541_08935 [Flavobacterium sp.]|nr:hypothetical protein [Flavobacterium sp.]